MPLLAALSRLRFNVDMNSSVSIEVFALALGEMVGTVVLDIDRHDKGGIRTHQLDDREQAADTILVECRTLLQILTQGAYNLTLKIDIEGDRSYYSDSFLLCAGGLGSS